MGLFTRNKIKIPTSATQEVETIDSWTLCWKIQGDSFMSEKVFYKVFIKEEEAKEFKTQLEKSAAFLNAWVKVSIAKN